MDAELYSKEVISNTLTITRKTHISIAFVFSNVPLNFSFCRGLVGNNHNLWLNLVASCSYQVKEDKFIWGCTRMVFSL
jgi:hypothetical protein